MTEKAITRPGSKNLGLWLRVVVCLVIANLLFSVGEGLQLRPFSSIPANELSQAFASADSGTAPYAQHVNPIEMTRVRKSEKRQSTPIDLPPLGLSFATHLNAVYSFADAPSFVSSASHSPSTGRAPPLSL